MELRNHPYFKKEVQKENNDGNQDTRTSSSSSFEKTEVFESEKKGSTLKKKEKNNLQFEVLHDSIPQIVKSDGDQ